MHLSGDRAVKDEKDEKGYPIGSVSIEAVRECGPHPSSESIKELGTCSVCRRTDVDLQKVHYVYQSFVVCSVACILARTKP